MTRISEKTVYVIPLNTEEITREEVGSKAKNLGDLARAGFPIPDGFVVTARALARFLLANNLASDSRPGSLVSAPLPPDLDEAINAAVARLGLEPVAVRSSGVAEDLPQASFAGQYETFLNVIGPEAIKDALQHCWASAFRPRVLAYRAGLGTTQGPSMAVIVQRMVLAL